MVYTEDGVFVQVILGVTETGRYSPSAVVHSPILTAICPLHRRPMEG